MTVWKPVASWPYEVSDHGEVRRIGGKILTPMRCGQKRKQYSTVRLCAGRKSKDKKVHILVLEAFVGPRPPGLLGCHADDDEMNNKLTNLYWGTHADNVRDACRHHNRLTYAQAREIRERRARGERGIHRDYNVSPQTICDIVKGRVYTKHEATQ